jgi:AcrR family transcriptional regulator
MGDIKLPRREREKLRQRKEILDTALDLFSEKGYHNVSMHEIARGAEFAIGTLYKFFKNKEDLYKALIMEQAGEFHDVMNKAIDISDNEIGKIRNYVKVKGEVFMNNTSMIRLYFAETRGASFNIKTGLDADIRKMYDDFLHKLAEVFENGIKKKRFKKILDPYYLAVALDSLTNAFLFLWLEDPKRHPYLKNVETIMGIFFNNVRIA